jgi:hypothetical protein
LHGLHREQNSLFCNAIIVLETCLFIEPLLSKSGRREEMKERMTEEEIERERKKKVS